MPRLDRTTTLLIGAIFMAAVAYFDFRARQPNTVEIAAPAERTSNGSGLVNRPKSGGLHSSSAERGGHPLAGLRLDDLSETIKRPLFELSRRQPATPPPPPPSQAVLPAPANTADSVTFRLLGTIIATDRSTAVLMPQGRAQAVRAEQGDAIDGWTIEQIKRNEVVLERNGKRVVVRMTRSVQ